MLSAFFRVFCALVSVVSVLKKEFHTEDTVQRRRGHKEKQLIPKLRQHRSISGEQAGDLLK